MLNRLLLQLACALWLPGLAAASLHHDLDITLEPQRHVIEVQDRITLDAAPRGPLSFILHPALQARLLDRDARLVELPHDTSGEHGGITPKRYRVELAPGKRSFTLHYRGTIRHPLQQQGEEYARSFRQTHGIIGPEGVFLAGSSLWYPQFDDSLLEFDIALHLPDGWYGMSQGERRARVAAGSAVTENWRCATPQEEIYLIAGRFTEYIAVRRDVTAMVLLRQPDAALARKYLDTTHQYVDLYHRLIGPYAFSKFALVENFWETGYGMPSFTLLGSKVIRFPFILHSSYPHEILHNWWGNSVYVDYRSGNWAEGLTSYLADHLIKEQQGQGIDYRRTVLQKYTDYVDAQEDFPLTAFRSRHSARTEAVGYGKTLMLFHMLRRQLGDQAFVRGLQALYDQQRFRVTGFADVQRVYSDVAGRPLDDFFAQWVKRSGAPNLRVSEARATPNGASWHLSALIEQTQPGEPYALRIPIAVQLDSMEGVWQSEIDMRERLQPVRLDLPARPVQLDIDPEFDLFRRLHRNEIPPSVSQAMGAGRVLIVLPAQEAPDLRNAYRAVAESWRQDKPEQIEVALDDALQTLPDDRAVWLFGWNNRFRAQLQQALQDYEFEDLGDAVRIEHTTLDSGTRSVVMLARHPRQPDHALGWLAADSATALPGLARKLPHYGRYSYLAFSGAEPENVLKGQWPVVNSPMSIRVAQGDGASVEVEPARLAPRQALVAPQETFSAARMKEHIAFFAASEMAGRGLGTAQLQRAADYIARQFMEAGLQPGGDDGGWYQAWEQPVEALGRSVTLNNVIGVLPGSDPQFAGESLVIGAHYDHLGHGESTGRREDRGRIHPGADDNASGVAVMLELARALQGEALPRTLVFVAFTGEEYDRLGSRHYVSKAADYPVGKTIAMLNLDTVGRLGDKPLILFGTGSAEEWAHIFRGAGYVTGVPVQTVADDFGSSDQTSFIQAGVPAVQFFSGAHADFHRPGDTIDKIDGDGLVKVANVAREVTQYLAERPQPLNISIAGAAPARAPGTRRVSFGTVPDFTWSGDGVRLDDVRADTPAALAGLRKGDIITSVNETPVRTMRDYSEALKQLQPGDEIRVGFTRDGAALTATARVTER
ncbi:MAG: M20/M25/M40 family metallo-hydrolase [Thiogranum sp.]|nr:M20/M25/M40 family metallo-hydrolase [Thiogranum sp.]